MNAREEIRANVDMLAVWLLTGPMAKADVVTDWNVTAGDKSLPCFNIARLNPFMMLWTAPPPARECHECGRC